MSYPPPIQYLVEQFNKLPGIGPRSAERIALFLVQSPKGVASDLARAIADARTQIRHCSTCGGYTTGDPCPLCAGTTRDQSLICVVEQPTDIFLLEKSKAHRGVYHVLGGKISPLDKIGPEQLRISQLIARVQKNMPQEIILALSADVEGEATATYLAQELKPLGVAVSRIARGLPVGASLESADELTLNRALEGRNKI
jgi:recombination protein RecR